MPNVNYVKRDIFFTQASFVLYLFSHKPQFVPFYYLAHPFITSAAPWVQNMW